MGRKAKFSKRKTEPRPRLNAKTTEQVKDWLKRTAAWETEEGASVRALYDGGKTKGKRAIVCDGRLRVTESDIIRRAVVRELKRLQEAGGPGPDSSLPN